MPVQSSTAVVAPAGFDGATLLTIAEVSALLRCSIQTVRRRVTAGDLPAFRVVDRGPWLFRRDDVLRQLTPVQASSLSSSHPDSTPPAQSSADWARELAGVPSAKGSHAP